MKNLVITLMLLGLGLPAHAQEKMVLDEATKELCNKIMMDIFTEIRDSQGQFPELQGFNENNLSKNPYGFLSINFENPKYVSPGRDYYYKFSLTIDGMEDQSPREPNSQPLQFGFPILGLKFQGYQVMRIRGRHFSLTPLIEKFGRVLYDHQQKYVKLKLVIEPEKRIYKIGERISFKVSLKNLTGQSLKVKPLNDKTLFFTINDRVWGTQPETAQPGESVKEEVLYPTYSVSRSFKGDSFRTSGEVEIRCTYNMVYKGVLPVTSTRLKIIPDAE